MSVGDDDYIQVNAVRKAVDKEDLSGERRVASYGTYLTAHTRLQQAGVQAILVGNIELRQTKSGCMEDVQRVWEPHPLAQVCLLHDGNSRETWMHVGQPSITSQNADTLPPPWTYR
jgi:hypothetical protein